MPSWKRVIISGSDAALNSLNVSTSLTASGIIYPTTDGTSGQVVITDGNGNLSFSNIENTTISIKNMSGGTIAKGTPCYITGSGTSGNLAGVWPADASNPLRMPAGVIAGETLTAGAEGIGLINGFISGVNTSAFTAGDSVYVAVGGGYTNVKPTGSSVLIQKLGNVEKSHASNGSGVINGPGYYNEVPNIQQGYTWVGNGNGVATPVATSSIQNVVSSSYALAAATASYVLNAVSASFTSTASFVNTLNQNVLITGSLSVGITSAGASENTLTLGARDNGNEGGQLGLNAPGGTYTSASMIDNYNNNFRILKGTNAGSTGLVAQWNLHNTQMQLPGYTSPTSMPGTVSGLLAFDTSGNIITTTTGSGGGGVTINNNTDNYIVTATGTANTLNGESGLQYNGTSLTVTGQVTASGAIISNANGAMYFRGGDDAEFWDINVLNTVGIYGQQTQAEAGLKLGSSGATLYGSGSRFGINTTTPTSASLTVNGNVWATSFTGSLFGTASWATNSTTATQTSQAVTFNNGGSGDASGTSFNGSTARTISYNTVGAPSISGTNATGTWGISITGTAATASFVTGSNVYGPFGSNSIISASFAVSSSRAVSSSFATTASYALTAGSTAAVAGTTNYVSKFTSGTTIGNSIIYDNGTNVGIGTTNPGNRLTIQGNISVRNSSGFDRTVIGIDAISSSPFVTLMRDSDTTVTVRLDSNSDSYFTGGNLGIGTTTPNSGALHVNGGVFATSFTGSLLGTASYATQALSASWAPVQVSASYATTASYVLNAVSSSFATTASYATTAGSVGSISANITNNTDNYVLTATGGSTVNGEANLTFDGTVLSANKVRLGRDWSLSNRGTIRIDSNGTSYPADILFGHTAAANETGWDGVYWSLSSRAGDSSNRFYIYRGAGNPGGSGEGVVFALDPNGNVGIGTTSPAEKLQVNGNILIDKGDNGYLSITNGSQLVAALGDLGGGTDGQLVLYDNSSTATVVLNGQANSYINSGNVGIGTTSPSTRLTVSDTNQFVATFSNTAVDQLTSIRIDNAAQSTSGVSTAAATIELIGKAGSSTHGRHAWIGAEGVAGDTYRTKVLFKIRGESNNGYQWAGSEAPTILTLDGNGPIRFNQYGAGTFTGTATQKLAVDSSGNIIEIPIGGGAVDGSGTTNYITKWTDADTIGNSVIYDNGTNVGIGTTSPGAKLQVETGADANVLQLKAASGNTADFGFDGLGSYIETNGATTARQKLRLQTYNGSAYTQLFIDGGNQYIYTNDNAKVGIGTATPATPLHVAGGSTGTGGWNKTATLSATYPGLIFNSNATKWGGIAYDFSEAMRFWVNAGSDDIFAGTLAMSILNGGNVGIGVTNPSNKLEVNGNIVAERYRGINSLTLNSYTTVNPSSNVFLYSQPNDRDSWIYLDSADTGTNWGIYHRQIDSTVSGLPGNSIGFIGGGSSALQAWISLENGNGYFAGTLTATTFVGALSGNATTATTLQTARNINGTSFNGSADITTANWGTTRTITIGSTGKSVNGSGNVSWSLAEIGAQAALTNPVTGTGTTNYLSKFTGTSALGNSVIYDNGTNVGIGTTSVSTYKLNVNGTSYFADSIYNGGGLISWTTGYSDGTTQTYQGNSLAFLTNTSSPAVRVFINSSGNVGIGTTSPGSYKLKVAGGQYGTYLKGGDLGTGSDILRLVDSGDNTKYLARGDGKHFFQGDVDIVGTLTATVKSFIIDHPTKQGKKLQYGVLEGPEHSVYVRGKLTNNNTITLPDHWHALVHEDTITVNLTPIGKRQDLWVETVTDTTITVGSDNEINCYYTVFAERKDIEKLVTEFDK